MTVVDSVESWLPPGKRAAVCFTIDDVHPGKSTDAYEAGGDLAKGALGQVERLLNRVPELRLTLFTTADWREISPSVERKILSRVPVVRDRIMLARTHKRGTMALDRHPAFVEYVRGLPRTEIALHGLHHVHTGSKIHIEFQEQDRATCVRMLRGAMKIFDDAGLPYAQGMCPPGWNAPPPLLEAMADVGLRFVASARDIITPITPGAVTNMSGITGVPLFQPARVAGGRLLHFTTNFQATSPIERAISIIESGGLVAVKAHIIKNAMGHIAVDGVDGVYMNYLELLFRELARRYGDTLWWTTFGEISSRVASPGTRASSSDRSDLRSHG